MSVPKLEIGQRVWKQGRKHPTMPNWMDCYGTIVGLEYFDEEDPDSDLETVVVMFESGTTDDIPSEEFCVWNTKNESWSLFTGD